MMASAGAEFHSAKILPAGVARMRPFLILAWDECQSDPTAIDISQMEFVHVVDERFG